MTLSGGSRRSFLIGGIAATAWICGPWRQAAATSRSVLRYGVRHSRYGDIGSYANTIDRGVDGTIVRNEVHLLVKILGIVLHREDADRTETWSEDRLIAFRGVTTVNGESTTISGAASDMGFAVTTSKGTVMAPADIRPSNPWSGGFRLSNTMLRTDTGEVEKVQIGPGSPETISIGSKTIAATAYGIAATPAYKIWLDPNDAPVKFTVSDDSGLVTFTLQATA